MELPLPPFGPEFRLRDRLLLEIMAVGEVESEDCGVPLVGLLSVSRRRLSSCDDDSDKNTREKE